MKLTADQQYGSCSTTQVPLLPPINESPLTAPIISWNQSHLAANLPRSVFNRLSPALSSPYECHPLAMAINPFHPPKLAIKSSPHKRPRPKSPHETSVMADSRVPECMLYTEMHAVICLEALRSRYDPASTLIPENPRLI
jgi:hypothetical protein